MVLCVETQASSEKVLGVSRDFGLSALEPDQCRRSQMSPFINMKGVCIGCVWLAGGCGSHSNRMTLRILGELGMGRKGQQAAAFLDLPLGITSDSEKV